MIGRSINLAGDESCLVPDGKFGGTLGPAGTTCLAWLSNTPRRELAAKGGGGDAESFGGELAGVAGTGEATEDVAALDRLEGLVRVVRVVRRRVRARAPSGGAS